MSKQGSGSTIIATYDLLTANTITGSMEITGVYADYLAYDIVGTTGQTLRLISSQWSALRQGKTITLDCGYK